MSHSVEALADDKKSHIDQQDEISKRRVSFLAFTRLGLADAWGSTGPRLQACTLRFSFVAACTRDVECTYTQARSLHPTLGS